MLRGGTPESLQSAIERGKVNPNDKIILIYPKGGKLTAIYKGDSDGLWATGSSDHLTLYDHTSSCRNPKDDFIGWELIE